MVKLSSSSLVIAGGTAITIGLGALGYPYIARTIAHFSKQRAFPVVSKAALKGACQTGLSVLPQQYPQVRRDAGIVEDLHGIKVADPYRWLEDPDSEETQAFVEAQNRLTTQVLSQCETREPFRQLFTKLYDYPKFGTPFKRADRYYYYHNSGLQQQYVLYSQDSPQGVPTVLIDPNTLSEDGTVSLKGIEFSENGQYLSYSLSSGGSDWATIQVMSIGAGGIPTPLPDKLEFVKFSCMAWTHDHRGFFYNRYADPKKADLGTETDINTNQLLCYHELGTPQSSDSVVFAMPDHPTRMSSAEVSDDGRYMLLSISEGCQPANRVYFVDLSLVGKTSSGALDFQSHDFFTGSKKLPVVKLVDNFDASYGYVANEGSVFSFMTNLHAPRYRIVRVDLSCPGTSPSAWSDLVPQHDKDVLQGASALKGDHIVVRYLRDVCGVIQLRQLSTGVLVKELPLPGAGSVSGLSGSRKETEIFFSFQSFAEPGATYRYDVSSPSIEPTLFRRTELKVPHKAEDYTTTQVFVQSRDGTRVPLFITHRNGLKLDGSHPTLLYGYGGFNISLEPSFSASRLAFMKGYDGVFASANLRGGGEYGTSWRDSGSKENKQNVFDDFQACAEHLISAGYCSPSKLTIQGGSNGGLLVAACANQRPDLYACVLGQVGVMDMLRFHKFTIGHAWCTDYGNPDSAKEFEYIYPYSPLHNVRIPEGGKGQYPAVLLLTGDHDDRVVPLHSHKLAATLQYELVLAPSVASRTHAELLVKPGEEEDCANSVAQRNPLLIRVEVRAGHGAGKPTAKVIEEVTDMICFAAKSMQATWVLASDE